jgi:hypothetical protein
MRHRFRFHLPALLGLFAPLFLSAAESDDGFRIFQNSAPEFVKIEVTSVDVANTGGVFSSNATRVAATARVIDVIWSRSGLSPGATIEIRYAHRARGGSSAETPPILKAGSIVPAFLVRKGAVYETAARHHSFNEPTAAQWKKFDLDRVLAREAALTSVTPVLEPVLPRSPSVDVAVREPSPPAPAETAAPPVAAPASPAVDDLPLPAPGAASTAEPPRAEPVIETAPVVAEPLPLQTPDRQPPRTEPVATEPPPLPPQQGPTPSPVPESEPIRPIAVQSSETAPPTITPPTSPMVVTAAEEAGREGYSAIYTLIKQGEVAQLEGKATVAKESYIQAREKLIKLKAEQPDFQPFMVEYRLKDLKKRLDQIEASQK